MTKRFGNFDPQGNKKPKLDDDIDALWGEDVDEGALEDCMKLVTQICDEDKITNTQLNNVTILPTYCAFKDKSIICSTQVNIPIPSTSKYEPPHVNKKGSRGINLETDINSLQKQYQEKEGEVAVLRTQIQEFKSSVQIEQQKVHNEWRQKLNVTEKQLKSIKTELEFKDLEIANLKQKVLYVTKHSKNLDTTLNATQQNTENKIPKKEQVPTVEPNRNQYLKIQPILHPVHPLEGIVSDITFDVPKREQYTIKTKLVRTCRNSVPYLQNQVVSTTLQVDKSGMDINFVYPELFKLTHFTEQELNSHTNRECINRVICSCEQYLNDLETFLIQIKDNLRTEDILEIDTFSLKQQEDRLSAEDKDIIGLKAGILLNFVAELFSYNKYVIKYICQNADLCFENKDIFIKQFPYLASKKQKYQQHYFLNTLLSIVKTSGEIRKATLLSNFFCSAIKLLTNIVKSKQFDYVSDIVCNMTQEIILSRPRLKVIIELTFLFKVISQNSVFIEFLFNKSQNSITSKKGVLYFNEDACRFYIFVMLFDNTILKLNCDEVLKMVCLNMLCFMYNTFQTSSWIHHRNAKDCECVPQLYKLEIELVFKALEKYVGEIKNTRKPSSEWTSFFKNGITVKVLSLMAFNSYELTEKYITVFSQYKEIERKLQEENISELEKLNISEEIVEIPNNAFVNIDF